jgi:pimeloyl-ACP methyl ester carboxylesterase
MALASAPAWSQDVPSQQATTEAEEPATAAGQAVQYREQTYLVPVTLPHGHTAQLHARLCRPPGEAMARLVVINHGTPPNAADRRKVPLGRCDQEAAQWFLRRGYVVAFALRRGYGETGGIDEENFDQCQHANFVRAGLESALDIDAIVNATTRFPFVLPARVVVVGQSTGGWATLAYNAVPHPKVSAFINMAGGRGGHHRGVANDNCQPGLLVESAKVFGRTATTPMLWIYTANDSFFGPRLAASLWHAFASAGGQAEFDQLGPYGQDGHRLFFGKGGSEIWGPLVEHYLE